MTPIEQLRKLKLIVMQTDECEEKKLLLSHIDFLITANPEFSITETNQRRIFSAVIQHDDTNVIYSFDTLSLKIKTKNPNFEKFESYIVNKSKIEFFSSDVQACLPPKRQEILSREPEPPLMQDIPDEIFEEQTALEQATQKLAKQKKEKIRKEKPAKQEPANSSKDSSKKKIVAISVISSLVCVIVITLCCLLIKPAANFYGEVVTAPILVQEYDTSIDSSHLGIDLTSADDFNVYAFADGEIISIEVSSGEGEVLSISHQDGYVSCYKSIKISDKIKEKVGEYITKGEILGEMTFDSFEHDFPFVHLEIKINGEEVDPFVFIFGKKPGKEEPPLEDSDNLDYGNVLDGPILLKEFADNKLQFNEKLLRWGLHDSIDLLSDNGIVYCFADGKIKSIENSLIYGTTIVIEHTAGYVSTYKSIEPASENIAPGYSIQKGEIIGNIAESEFEYDFPFLHFELSLNDKRIDPTPYIFFEQEVSNSVMDSPTLLKVFANDKLQENDNLQQWEAHLGVDITSDNLRVYSFDSGVITDIQESEINGGVVVIDHGNGFVSTYMSLEVLDGLAVGQSVAKGQHIGSASDKKQEYTNGQKFLHFELEIGGQKINPLEYISI